MGGGAGSLWRNRDFTLVWGGEALSELGSQVSTVALPLLVLALGGSAAQAGLVGFAKTLPLALAALPAGVVVDRVDRKRLMLACDAVRALALASIPVALALGRPPPAQLAAVAFVDGCLFTLAYVAERGALRQLVAPEQVPDAIARNEARTFAASIAGPPLGGVLFGIARFLPFAVDAASYGIAAAALARTRTRFQEERRDGEPAAARGLLDGLRWMWQRPFFRATALLFGLGNPLFTGLYLLAVLLARHRGAPPAQVGALFAVVGAGGLLGAILAAPLRRRLPAGPAVVGDSWVIAAAIPLLLIAHAPLAIGAVIALAELPTPTTNSIVSGRRVALAPDHLQGRTQAAGMLVAQSLGWTGPLAVGLLFEHAGPTATVLAVAGWALALALGTTLTPAVRGGPPTG